MVAGTGQTLSLIEVGFWLRAGWPIRSMEGLVWQASERPITYDAAWALPSDTSPTLPAILLRPIWPGFAINTLFYATILWLLIPGPFALRGFIRRKRGQCPACGYPAGESAVCSECGKELRLMPAT